MRKLVAILCFVCACAVSFAQAGPAVATVHRDSKGLLHIVTTDGHDSMIHPAKWQNGGGFEQIRIAPDRRTVAWLVDQVMMPHESGASYSYAVPLDLEVWRDGRVIRRFPASGGAIQDWIFLKDGSEVAFHTAPLHGQQFYYCVLFSVKTGKMLAQWSLDRRNYVVPGWAKPLLAHETLPGPDEVSRWLRDKPAPEKKAPQTKQK